MARTPSGTERPPSALSARNACCFIKRIRAAAPSVSIVQIHQTPPLLADFALAKTKILNIKIVILRSLSLMELLILLMGLVILKELAIILLN